MQPLIKRRNGSCLKGKIDAVTKLENGFKPANVATEFGVSVETIRRWKVNKEIIKKEYEDAVARGESFERRRRRKVQNKVLEDALYEWYKKEKGQGIAVSGPMIAAKALILNDETGGDPLFNASHGWLQKWKKRHGIRENSSALVTQSEAFEGFENGEQDSQVGKYIQLDRLYTVCGRSS